MNLNELLDKIKKIYSCMLKFIEDEENIEENFQNLNQIIDDSNIKSDSDDFKAILHLINKISINHTRVTNFFEKFEQILKFLKSDILKFYSNSEISKIFQNNNRILLYLLEEKIISVDESFVSEYQSTQYFFPEIKSFINEQIQSMENPEEYKYYKLIKNLSNTENSNDFNEKRHKGENDDYICELIRNDSIEDFIIYVNKNDYSLNTDINPSIFETNIFFLKNTKIKLIEYAAFFGSIQIFRYLFKNEAKYTNPSFLFICAVHGDNPEMIHFLDDNFQHISYEECLKESIKCHHNDVANYIQNIYFIGLDEKTIDDRIVSYYFNYYNFDNFPENISDENLFLLSCEYDYLIFVKHLLKNKKIDIDMII